MRLLLNKKIAFLILALLTILAIVSARLVNFRPKQNQIQNAAFQAQPAGTCAPNAACKGNPELCMADNLNKVCD